MMQNMKTSFKQLPLMSPKSPSPDRAGPLNSVAVGLGLLLPSLHAVLGGPSHWTQLEETPGCPLPAFAPSSTHKQSGGRVS